MRYFFFALGTLLTAGILQAETIYLELNPGCTERFEYLDNFKGQESRSVDYHLRRKGGRVVFSTPQATSTPVSQIPTGALGCKTDRFNQKLIDEINAGKHQVYLVEPAGKNYHLVPVASAAIVSGADGQVNYRSNDTRFAYNTTEKRAGNWASADSPNRVFFEGSKYRFCYRAISFRSIPDDNAAPFTEMVVIPEIGVVETRTGITPEMAKSNTRRLVKVGNIPFGQYIKAVCAGDDPANYDVGDLMAARGTGTSTATTTTTTTTATAPTTGTPAAGSKAAVVPSEPVLFTESEFVPEEQSVISQRSTGECNIPPAPGVHVVQRGETLYGISRKYGVTVDQLKKWNKMSDHKLAVCMPLNVIPPVTVTTTTTTTTPATTTPAPAPTVPATTTTTTTTTAKVPAGPSTTSVTPTTTPKNPVPGGANPRWVDTNGTHVVMSGDKVADLAAKYGYTEARFRWMNGLDATDKLIAGQVLRTKECEVPGLAPKDRAMPFSTTTEAPKTTEKGATATVVAPTATVPTTTAPAKPTRRVHVVSKSETLYSISRAYGMSLDRLMELNDLTKGEVIMENMRLYVD